MQNHKILIDVFSWVASVEKHGKIMQEGVWRNAVHLARRYTPACFLRKNETVSREAVQMLGAYLGKPIAVLFEGEALDCDVWVSLAVDFPSPFLAAGYSAVRATIVNDDLCAKGVFGEEKKRLYEFGMKYNEVFLPITEHAMKCLELQYKERGWAKDTSNYRVIGCPHAYKSFTPGTPQIGKQYSLAVHSIYPRKRLTAEAALGSYFGGLVHAGHKFDASKDDLVQLFLQYDCVTLGSVSDLNLGRLYSEADRFICLSEDEGFSIPAMEAVMFGVRELWLSDIPAHREVYGDLNVNWVPLRALPFIEAGAHSFSLRKPQIVTEEQAERLFKRHHADNLNSIYYFLENL